MIFKKFYTTAQSNVGLSTPTVIITENIPTLNQQDVKTVDLAGTKIVKPQE